MRIKHALLGTAILFCLSSCDNGPAFNSVGSAEKMAPEGMLGGTRSNSNSGVQLAYSHMLGLEMPSANVKQHYERARDLCLKDDKLGCIMLMPL